MYRLKEILIFVKLQQLGFDGYALDYIICPEGMKYFLKSILNLHRTVSIMSVLALHP